MPGALSPMLLIALAALPRARAWWPEVILQAVIIDEDLTLSFLQTAGRFADPLAKPSQPAQLRVPRSVTRPQLAENLISHSGPANWVNSSAVGAAAVSTERGNGTRYRQVMYNTEDVQYVAEISIGNQDLMGVLDTGSFELVVFSDACSMCGDVDKLYAHKLSSSYSDGRLVATHSFGSGSVMSRDAFETVRIGPLRADHQKFWEATSAYMPILSSATFQAIVGVGPPNVPADDAWEVVKDGQAEIQQFQRAGVPVPSDVKEQAVQDMQIAQWTSASPTMLDSFGCRLFSVCLGTVPLSDGYFIWNDRDPRQRPALFTQLPVAGRATWGVQMFAAELQMPPHLGGAQHRVDLGCGKGCGAIVDSGTSLLAVPSAVVDTVQEALMSLREDCSNMNDMPSLTFRVGEHILSLPPDAYIGQVVDEQPSIAGQVLLAPPLSRGHASCRLLFMVQDSDTQFGPMWILGMPFFRKYYTTFDVGGRGGENRSLFVSRADSQCEPSAEPVVEPLAQGGPALLGSKVAARRVNASRLLLPGWAEKAAEQKYMTI